VTPGADQRDVRDLRSGPSVQLPGGTGDVAAKARALTPRAILYRVSGSDQAESSCGRYLATTVAIASSGFTGSGGGGVTSAEIMDIRRLLSSRRANQFRCR
jgi:hypothetical protein